MLVLELGLAHALLAPHAPAAGRARARLLFIIGHQGQDLAVAQGVLAGGLLDRLLLFRSLGAGFDDLDGLGLDLGALLLAGLSTGRGFLALFDSFRGLGLSLRETGLGLLLRETAGLFLRQATGLRLGLATQFLLRPPAGLFLTGLTLLLLQIGVAAGLDLGAARLEFTAAPGLVDARPRGFGTAPGLGGGRRTGRRGGRSPGGRGRCRLDQRRRGGRSSHRRGDRRGRRRGYRGSCRSGHRRGGRSDRGRGGFGRNRGRHRGRGRYRSRRRSGGHWRGGGQRGLALADSGALDVDPLLAHLDTDRLGPRRRGGGPGPAR